MNVNEVIANRGQVLSGGSLSDSSKNTILLMMMLTNHSHRTTHSHGNAHCGMPAVHGEHHTGVSGIA
jgi:hypothetical protein